MQNSPCHDCTLIHEDKNNPICFNCSARHAYMRSLAIQSGYTPANQPEQAYTVHLPRQCP